MCFSQPACDFLLRMLVAGVNALDRRKTSLVTVSPEPPYLSRGNADKRRPVAKRLADYDYDIKDEDEAGSEEDYIDVTSVDGGDKNLLPPKPKIRKTETPTVEQVSARERLYKSRLNEQYNERQV